MAAALRTKVELFYDVVSPYSFLAFEALCRYRPHWNMDLALRPFFLGGIMKEAGNRPPMMVPAKGLYMAKDLARNAAYFNVPLQMIEDPFETMVVKGTIRAQRLLTGVEQHRPELLEEVSRQLWLRLWTRGEDVVEEASLRRAAAAAGMAPADVDVCVGLVDDAAVKKRLKDTTDEAIEHGAFGAPSIVVHAPSGAELFFGADRFPLIAALLDQPWNGPNP